MNSLLYRLLITLIYDLGGIGERQYVRMNLEIYMIIMCV